MALKDIFFRNLNNYLAESGKQQVDLAKYCGVGTPTVSNWLSGLKVPRIDKLERICQCLSIEPADLYTDHSKTKQLVPYEYRTAEDLFRRLNHAGQAKALEYITDLTEQAKYTS